MNGYKTNFGFNLGLSRALSQSNSNADDGNTKAKCKQTNTLESSPQRRGGIVSRAYAGSWLMLNGSARMRG